MTGNSDLSDIRVMSPQGIPPWDPPDDDSGEWLAYEGWAEWVQVYGTLTSRVEVVAYRFEKAARTIMDGFLPAFQSAAVSMGKFAKVVSKDPPK